MANEGILDAKAVAVRCKISVSAVHRLAKRGTLPSEWAADRRIWRAAVVDRYLADRAAQSRRRGTWRNATLFQGKDEIPVDRVVNELNAQAPAGYDARRGLRGSR